MAGYELLQVRLAHTHQPTEPDMGHLSVLHEDIHVGGSGLEQTGHLLGGVKRFEMLHPPVGFDVDFWDHGAHPFIARPEQQIALPALFSIRQGSDEG